MRRAVLGTTAAISAVAVLAAILVPLRHDAVDPATAAVVLLLPVLLGAATGGVVAGLLAAAGGFCVYDWDFLHPYGTLALRSAKPLVVLAVYVVVALVVAPVVEAGQRNRRVAIAREALAARMLEVSEHLIVEQPLSEVLGLVVETVHRALGTRFVALLLPGDGGELVLAASAGELTDDDRAAVLRSGGAPQSLALAGGPRGLRRVALTATQRPVGQLVVDGRELEGFERRVLGVVANQAALAIERHQLRSQAVRAELLEEADHWRSALIGAVSHDLRTPLAAIKASVSTLLAPGGRLDADDHEALLTTVEGEADRLSRLVENLLDMARIESGSLQLHRAPHAVAEVLEHGVAVARPAIAEHRVVIDAPADLPLVEVDLVLIGQVLANLLANAAQHAPEGSTIQLSARREGTGIAVSVSDEGPGVPKADRERIFHLLDRRAGAGRAGLGLAISTAFVEAHDGTLSVDDSDAGGARFTFRVPCSVLEAAVR